MDATAAVAQAFYLQDVLILLLAAVFAVVAVNRLGWSPIVGYLVAGMGIGSEGLALITDARNIQHIAEVGVIFLMYTIGLELSFSRLKAMRRDVFGLGSLQVILTMAAVAGLWVLVQPGFAAAVVIGGALALSSTAVVLKILSERDMLATALGRKAFSVLLLQDLAVVPLLLLVTLLTGERPSLGLAAALAVSHAILALVVVTVLGRLVLRPLFRIIAATRSPEIFAAGSLLTVLGIAAAMEAVGLSAALGAFLAGLLLAETEYRQQIEMDIEPFKGLLLALFFMTVGMEIDIRFVLGHIGAVLALVVVLVCLKAAIIFALARLFGLRTGEALSLGLLLAQAGEFAFVILGLAATKGVLDPETAQLVMVATGVSIGLTPAFASLGKRLRTRLDGEAVLRAGPSLDQTARQLEDHVVIAGYGRGGKIVARLLDRHKIPYVALDLHPDTVATAFKRGLPVFYGNASRADILGMANVKRAQAVVVTLDNAAAAARTVQAIHGFGYDIPILVRAHDVEHCVELERLGASISVPEALEAGLQLAGLVLETIGTPKDAVRETIAEFRRDDYAHLLEDARAGNHDRS